jgi:hypothetical protein
MNIENVSDAKTAYTIEADDVDEGRLLEAIYDCISLGGRIAAHPRYGLNESVAHTFDGDPDELAEIGEEALAVIEEFVR